MSSGTQNDVRQRLKAKILLQVQSHGEAWYVHPVDGKRYYMKDGEQAYIIMRRLSLGISNADLSGVPTGSLQPNRTLTFPFQKSPCHATGDF